MFMSDDLPGIYRFDRDMIKIKIVFKISSFYGFNLLLIISGPNNASNSSIVSLHRADLLESNRAEDFDNVSMHSGKIMTPIGKARLFAAPDLEFLDNSEIVDKNIEQSKLVAEASKDLMAVGVNADSVDFFGKVLPIFKLVG